MSKKAPLGGKPGALRKSGEAPCCSTTLTLCSGRPRLTMRRPAPAANRSRGDERSLWPDDGTEGEAGQRGHDDARQYLRRGGPPPTWSPSAGEWPPLPGRYWIDKPARTPAKHTTGNGHQIGSL